MKNSSDVFPQVNQELAHYLGLARQAVGNEFLPENFCTSLEAIVSKNDLITIYKDKDHSLWWFIPAILYSLYDQSIDFDWLEKDEIITKSMILIPPPFVAIEKRLATDISSLGLRVSHSRHSFTLRLIGLLYGGFPWFESYWRVCAAKKLLDQECVVLSVEADNADAPTILELFKRRHRNSYGLSLQLACDDLAYPGVVRPFHSPSRIETTRHRCAVNIQ
jgi:hypothetical protein